MITDVANSASIALLNVNLGQNVLKIFLIGLHKKEPLGIAFKYFDEICGKAILTTPSPR